MKRALIIVGKAPRPGVTKTRLSPPLSLEQAARLYRGFLHDTVAMALLLDWECVTVIYPPDPGAHRELAAFLPSRIRLQAQRGDGLGAALAGAFDSHFEEGFDRVVLIGSDSPTLSPAFVRAACAGLRTYDLAIGPTADGGYYLLGMTRPHLDIFEEITWSTPAVYEQTLARARACDLRILPVQEWYDIDSVVDLQRLCHDLARLPAAVAPATRAALADVAW